MRRLAPLIFSLAFVVCFGSALVLQKGLLKRLSEQPDRFHDWLYLPSSEHVRLVASGYDHFMADFLWLRVIQVFGATFAHEEYIQQLSAYFDVITDLDPHFIAAYSFGNLVLGEEGKDWERGLAILDKGIFHNPDKYKLGFEAAFFSFWTMKDPQRARYYAEIAARASDCPDYVKGWSSYFDLEMGRYIAAFEYFFKTYAVHYNGGHPDLAEMEMRKLRRSVDRWYIAELREKAIEYRDSHGGVNPTVDQLERAGALNGIEWPDWQALSGFIDRAVQDRLSLPDTEDEVHELLTNNFMKTQWPKMPPSPRSISPNLPGYIIWPGLEPNLVFDDGRVEENPVFCTSEIKAADQIRKAFATADALIEEYQGKNDGQCPPDLRSIDPELADAVDPWSGEEWIWDLENCEIRSPTLPIREELQRYPFQF